MCTVSFVTSQDKIIITSNRDEQTDRPALPPETYEVNGKNLLFPKDPRAGGTWFAADEYSNVAVLLNGAGEAHEHKPPYRKSRGLVVLDILCGISPIASWKAMILDNIEPFTIVLYESPALYQLRWDGKQATTLALDPEKDYIWSSATLYPKEVRDKRSHWFYAFMEDKPQADENDMLQFHHYTENENTENGLVINRAGQLRTLSITQAVIDGGRLKLLHHNLIDDTVSENRLIALAN